MQKLTLLLLFPLFVLACHHDDEPEEEKGAERTVLVYLAAENNLTSFANEDLKEMKAGSKSLNNRQNLIVYVDQAGTTPPYMARIKNGVLVDSVSMTESLSADPAILEQVIRRTKEKYPAQDYGLVFWGHAFGWFISNDSVEYAQSRAYGGDTGNGSAAGAGRYWMNIPSMAKAIKRGMGSIPLKFILGDCCNFGCIEIAYEMRNVTEYVIASPAEIPDKGAPYEFLVPDLFNTSDLFYQPMIDRYYKYYLDEYNQYPGRYYNYQQGDLKGYSVPLSAIKTVELEHFATATARLLHTISDKIGKDGVLNFENTVYYTVYSGYKCSYDIYHTFKTNASAADFSAWETAFEKAVPYRVFSGRWLSNNFQIPADMEALNANGNDCGEVSMFFPQAAYHQTYPSWNESIKRFQWNNVIRWEQYGW